VIITDHEIRMIIQEELYRNSLLSEAMDVGTGVNVKGDYKTAGVVRGKKDGKKGTWYLVHWTGTMADKIPEKDHIDNPGAMDWLSDGEIQKGWTVDTLKSIVNKYPEKGVFTWKQRQDLDSQKETGISSTGARTGHTIPSEELETWADAGMSFFATVADLPPFAAIGGAAISVSIGTAQALKAISKQHWLEAGLFLIALIPFIGDSWKAAYPWMKMLAKAESARKGVTLSTSALSLLAGMVSSWDEYKGTFSQLAEKVVGESDDSGEAKNALTPGVIKSITNAIDKEVEGFRKVVQSAKQAEKGKKVSESVSLTRRQIRNIIHKTLDEGKPASKSTGKPYKGSRRGKTESQAQQMAAGIALRAREEGSKESAIRKLKGAPKEMAKMSMKDLRKLATIRRGSEVPDSTKKGHERAALPGHIKKGKK
jgi:hypothetical protein